MKLQKIVTFKGTIKCETGASIKGMNNDINIGGADSEVIKNPLTREPYIPGSSIKGKMRSQLEKKYGMKSSRGEAELSRPCGCGEKKCMTCVVFGAHMNTRAISAPTRITVRDASFSDKFREVLAQLPVESGSYLEVKAENIIRRDKGTADSPRFTERVPAGAEFELEILLQVFEGDDEQKMIDYIVEGLELIKLSSLGGSGSRGYGKVDFDYKIEQKEV